MGARNWRRAPLFGVRDVGLFALGWTAVFSGLAVILVRSQHPPTPGASVAVLLMIVPVAFVRRWPLPSAAAQAAGSLLNGIVFGHLIRCGVGLPSAFYVAFVVGERASGRLRLAGIACVLIGVAGQVLYDPRLHPFANFALMGPVTQLFFGAGMLVQSRSAMIARLRDRNAELRAQRERTARLAVESDRLRIRTDLDDELLDRIQQIARTTDSALTGSDSAGASLARIETTGRDTLESMRDIVGTMRTAPTSPEPGLGAMAELLRSATTANAKLSVTGDFRSLPASIELSGYRIVEHLLSAVQDEPGAHVQVRLHFSPEQLELFVGGPPAGQQARTSVVSVVRDRAALHGGTVETAEPGGTWEARVRLPLVAGYA